MLAMERAQPQQNANPHPRNSVLMISPPRKSKSKQLTDAVAKWIGEAFVVPVRSVLAPSFDLRKISAREIRVWPSNREVELLTRGGDAKAEYELAVAVVERLKPSDDEDVLCDELLALAESVGDNLMTVEFDVVGGVATVVGFTHEPLYDRELLESHRIFGAGIAVQLSRVESP